MMSWARSLAMSRARTSAGSSLRAARDRPCGRRARDCRRAFGSSARDPPGYLLESTLTSGACLSGSAVSDASLTPPLLGWFQESRSHLPRTQLRRVYDLPPAEVLAEADLAEVGRLFQGYSIDRIRVPGLPIAMDRLRAIFERYEQGSLVASLMQSPALRPCS